MANKPGPMAEQKMDGIRKGLEAETGAGLRCASARISRSGKPIMLQSTPKTANRGRLAGSGGLGRGLSRGAHRAVSSGSGEEERLPRGWPGPGSGSVRRGTPLALGRADPEGWMREGKNLLDRPVVGGGARVGGVWGLRGGKPPPAGPIQHGRIRGYRRGNRAGPGRASHSGSRRVPEGPRRPRAGSRRSRTPAAGRRSFRPASAS